MGRTGEFRWRFHDDCAGDQWSRWHVTPPPCPACCCGGPDEGEHQEPAEYYDEDGILSSYHARHDPDDPDIPTTQEWRLTAPTR